MLDSGKGAVAQVGLHHLEIFQQWLADHGVAENTLGTFNNGVHEGAIKGKGVG